MDHYYEKTHDWDFGLKAKDCVYFPLSDSWRNVEDKNQIVRKSKEYLGKIFVLNERKK